jgi:hypothetical protein
MASTYEQPEDARPACPTRAVPPARPGLRGTAMTQGGWDDR